MEIVEIRSDWHYYRAEVCLKSINKQIKELEKNNNVTVINIIREVSNGSSLDFVYIAFLVLNEKDDKKFIG